MISDILQVSALVLAVVGVGLFLTPVIGTTGAVGAALVLAGVLSWLVGRTLDLARVDQAQYEAKLEAIRRGVPLSGDEDSG